ncbi:MAG: pantetheine-phosphate adenylyltransferase, partial [Spirochaetaceae bacterium]|nr:pantetheine-phosphate adenylyltransferase [Spirochaetaceae bacterium]
MIKAAFPGSFDPPTLGHLDIVERASALFDELVLFVADNHGKHCLFSPEERVRLLSALAAGLPNVQVRRCSTLVTDAMRAEGIGVLVRGIRGERDFSFEFDMARWNRLLAPEIETVVLFPRAPFEIVSSSAVRELLSFGKDV